MEDKVIFPKGEVTKVYGSVQVTICADRDVMLSDWAQAARNLGRK